MRELDWKRTRFIMLSLDPKLYDEDPWVAVDEAQNKKYISQFIHNLKRVHNIVVTDFVWFLEWHVSTGMPHWHLLIESEKRGRFGMIGGEVLRKTWKKGRVRETYPKSNTHWNNITGYFEKHGYFDKEKDSQSTLPEWALEYPHKIRRTGSKHKKREKKDNVIEEFEERKKIKEWRKKIVKTQLDQATRNEGCSDYLSPPLFKRYRLILEECGTSTRVHVDEGYSGHMMILEIPYKFLISKYPQGEYRKGLGYCINLGEKEFTQFNNTYANFKITKG